jgi:hypothetical protein
VEEEKELKEVNVQTTEQRKEAGLDLLQNYESPLIIFEDTNSII